MKNGLEMWNTTKIRALFIISVVSIARAPSWTHRKHIKYLFHSLLNGRIVNSFVRILYHNNKKKKAKNYESI